MYRVTGLSLGILTGVGLGLFYTGKVGYFTLHNSPEWMETAVWDVPQVAALVASKDYTLYRPWNKDSLGSKVFSVPGGISSPVAFIDNNNPSHTLQAVYCGSKTGGFPFIVHGGVLGTLLEESFDLATKSNWSTGWSDLSVSYHSPTWIGQFIFIETNKGPNGLEAVITNTKGKRLATAVAK